MKYLIMATFPNCKNTPDPKKREKLVSAYNITPVAHVKLLPGPALQGCCGPITDDCYTFAYQNKSNSEDEGLFSVGRHCADDFFALTGTKAPPVFNPLKSTTPVTVTTSGNNGTSGSPGMPTMHALNNEVYAAINLLTLDWGPPKPVLLSFLNAIAVNPASPLSKDKVVHLNNIIGKDVKGRTLSGIIGNLQQAHPDMRSFSFPKIEAVLSSAGKISKF